MKQLNREIASMKTMKVDLMKKMKSESEKFKTWKNQRERELLKLKAQDCKRLNQINKMEMMHSRQQNVLKRKVEEAAAVNKRLKDTLAKRKTVQDMKAGKGERVTEWVSITFFLKFYFLYNSLTDKSRIGVACEYIRSPINSKRLIRRQSYATQAIRRIKSRSRYGRE